MLTGQSTNQLELKINKAKFSSLVPAYWEIGLSISSPSFYGYSIEKKHNFKTSFNAWSACDNSAAAFSPAVQRALRELVIHPNFPKLAGQCDC